jgi:signal transduction histidine kinase
MLSTETGSVETWLRHSPGSWAPMAVLARQLSKPIQAIRDAMSVMESAEKLPGAMGHARRLIGRQVRQLSILVDDVLELESLARGTFRLQRDWIDLVPEVEAAVSACSWAVAGCQHSLCMQVPDVPVYGYVDPVKLRQVVTNLLDNVCKHTQVLGRVYLQLKRVGEEAVLTIAQEGASVSSSEFGPDIGLALVRELVQLHGGSIETRSADAGRGRGLVARLPLGCPLLLPKSGLHRGQ